MFIAIFLVNGKYVTLSGATVDAVVADAHARGLAHASADHVIDVDTL